MKKLFFIMFLIIGAWTFLCFKFNKCKNITATVYNTYFYDNVQPKIEDTFFDGIIQYWDIEEEESKTIIPIQVMDSHYSIDVIINGVKMDFILDTGCTSPLVMSTVEYEFLRRHGYITQSDIFETNCMAEIADGTTTKMFGFIAKDVKIGGIILHNVKCYVGDSPNYGRLLGKDLLSQLGDDYTISNKKGLLIINNY